MKKTSEPAKTEIMSSHEVLSRTLVDSQKSALDKAIELSVAVALSAVAVPKGTEIEALSKLNPKTPVYFSILQEYEKRMNQLLGVCKATGLPLVPQMKWISGMVQTYMRITPSTGKSPTSRADALLETIATGRALQRQPDMGRIPFGGVEEDKIPSDEKY